MIRCFIAWLKLFDVNKKTLKVRLHLYKNMNIPKEQDYWKKELGVSSLQFRKPYIKETTLHSVKQNKGGFGHGTCNVILGGQEFADKILMGIRYLRGQYGHLVPLKDVK